MQLPVTKTAPTKAGFINMIRYSHAVQAFALLGVLVLAACGGPTTTQDMYKGERQGPALVKQPQKPAIPPKRLAAIKAHGLDRQAKPTRLVGMDQIDIKRTLGKPHFIRKDKGVEIWQYKAENCILDLFLYQEGNKLSVDHTELRGPLLDSAGELSCFKAIVMGETS